MRIVNFPRFIISISIVTCIVSFIMSMMTSQVLSAEPVRYDNIIVAKGDTLWGIASQLDGDIKANIYEIKIKNGLTNSVIYEGQNLLIPKR